MKFCFPENLYVFFLPIDNYIRTSALLISSEFATYNHPALYTQNVNDNLHANA